MSLRIYIKGTPKFSSPKKSDSMHTLSSHFNPLPSSKTAHPSKKSLMVSESQEASLMSEISPQRSEQALRSFDENVPMPQRLEHKKEKKERKASVNDRYMNFQKEESRQEKIVNYAMDFQNKQKVFKAIRDFQKKVNQRENISDKQVRGMLQESNGIITGLLQELERTNEVLSEKVEENEELQNLNEALNENVRELERRVLENVEEARSEEKRNRSSDSFQQRRFEEINKKLSEELAAVKQKLEKTDEVLQRERKSFMTLREKVEALLDANSDLNAKAKAKEAEANKLEAALREAMSNTEKLLQEVYGKNQLIEELRRSLVVADFQSPVQNSMTRRLREEVGNFASPGPDVANHLMTWSTLRIESPSNEKMKEESEWQKKYEVLKNDNARLLKIIEGNQIVIKELKESFNELERRNHSRFEEMTSFYETKIGGFGDDKSSTKRELTDRANNEASKAYSGIANSFSSSQIGHSKRGSQESVWKEK